MSKWSPRHLTCLVCVTCVPFNWIFGDSRFLSVNVIWLHLLVFTLFVYRVAIFLFLRYALVVMWLLFLH